MKFFERVLVVVDQLSGGRISSQFREAAQGDIIPDRDENQFRRLTRVNRDLLPIQYNKASDLSFYLWQRNPMAKRLIEIVRDFCVGDEFVVDLKIMKTDADGHKTDTDRQDAQEIWDKFANDSVNDFYGRLTEMTDSFLLLGELHLPVSVNPGNGFVRFGYADPKLVAQMFIDGTGINIDRIEYSVPATSIVFVQGAIAPFASTGGRSETTKILKVIRLDETVDSLSFGKLTGDVFYFRLNHMMNQARGYGELIQWLDWIDAFDQMLFNDLEGAALRNNFIWDATFTGADQAALDKLDFAPPTAGSTKAHNEKVSWQAIAPDLKSKDQAELTRMFKNFIVGMKGFPAHWFGEGENSNRATAQMMDAPTMRMLKARQNQIRRMVEMVAKFVVDQAVIAGALDLASDESVEVKISSFDFERDNALNMATAFKDTMAALIVGMQSNLISEENAKRVVDGILQRYGIDIDPNETIEDVTAGKIGNENAAATKEALKLYQQTKQQPNLIPTRSQSGSGGM